MNRDEGKGSRNFVIIFFFTHESMKGVRVNLGRHSIPFRPRRGRQGGGDGGG